MVGEIKLNYSYSIKLKSTATAKMFFFFLIVILIVIYLKHELKLNVTNLTIKNKINGLTLNFEQN